MARVLIVGCDAGTRDLVSALRERGHVVRCTVASADDGNAIDAEAEVVEADPDRLGTLLPHLQGVSAVCWLAGDSPRLEPLVETLVDTHARGLVCKGGPGAEAARRVADANRVAIEIVGGADEMAPALDRLLSI